MHTSAEAEPRRPSAEEFLQMARRRYQAPEPIREGKWWYLRVWQDVFVAGFPARKRKRGRIKLAPASMPEREVKKIAAEILRPVNQGLVTVGSAVNFMQYVTDTYTPTVLPLLATTTRGCYEGVIRKHLEPTFGASCLRDLDSLTLQRYFSGMRASGVAHPTMIKIRDALSSVLRSAVKFGFLVRNPLDGIQLPPDKKGKPRKPYMTPEQFEQFVALVPEPYATMLYTAVWTGLRVSELIALRWEDVHADSLTVDERCSRGDWSQPKSKASNATIGVAPGVISRIHRLKSLTVAVRAGRATRRYKGVKSALPGDLVFQSVRTGGEMNDNNILKRFIKPAAHKLGLGFVNWRCLRTSHATWLVEAGADPKSVQGQMRHSRISTTMDIYAQFVSESARRAVNKLSAMVEARTAAHRQQQQPQRIN